MAANRDDIKQWFIEGVQQKYTHMIVMCDTYDWDDYPSYCRSVEEARLKVANAGEMQRVMEVYNLSMDMEKQLVEYRSKNY